MSWLIHTRFLLSEIIRLNVFGCPRKSLHSHFTKLGPKASSKAHHTTGLFVIASYINHSCFSNARRSFIGDMQIVRATRDMPAETEVFFWYAVPDGGENYEKTKENLSNWGFECTCTICLEKKKIRKPLFNRRMGFRADLTSAFNNDGRGPDIARMERIIAAMENTYSASASSVPRLAIRDPYLLLIRIYSTTNQSDLVITTVFKALKALGFMIAHPSSSQSVPDFEIKQWGFMADTLAEVWAHLWIAYARLAPHLCAKAEAMAKACYKICVGEDVTFDEKYGEVARRAISGAGDVMDEIRKLMVY